MISAEEINDVTPTITGTTSAPEGTLIQVVVTDQNGNSQNVTSVVENDGTFTLNVDSALPEGGFTVEASITDNQGNTTTVSVNSSVDITAPAINNLTIDSDSDTPSIAGDTDAQPGTNVIITVTDANGDSQVINSVVQDDGSFSGTPDTALADGEFTVVTQVTDEAGNTTSQTTTGSVGTTTPTVTDTDDSKQQY
ncbi:Ig-like domain-containing protein [Paraglaciecola sp. Hal342]